ncbi:hypothetical protein THASP1DRAFT_31322 [Thamnocephalis sphaerospora]|uniref:Uncharacterized protein n=1 Tax=Thamnocephalis sphaerospora TaxID=78915 RepID=A0A4P9XLU8_9FUNG|nr:hypothetical protein THASP1DRAFT_31322 [Thamnocephalis sphaerospora]|eukprot:RKP06858.1 hypothetical protein THASP1DRAFT_31322 [Thamnocephalis sphaerospora]
MYQEQDMISGQNPCARGTAAVESWTQDMLCIPESPPLSASQIQKVTLAAAPAVPVPLPVRLGFTDAKADAYEQLPDMPPECDESICTGRSQRPKAQLATKLVELHNTMDVDSDAESIMDSIQTLRRIQSQRQAPRSRQSGGYQQHHTFPAERGQQWSLSPQIALHLHQLRLQNSYLIHQNRAATRELTHAKCTTHALRTVCLQKEQTIVRLQSELATALDRIRLLEATVAEYSARAAATAAVHTAVIAEKRRSLLGKKERRLSGGLDSLSNGILRGLRRSVDGTTRHSKSKDQYANFESDEHAMSDVPGSPRASNVMCRYGRRSLDSARDSACRTDIDDLDIDTLTASSSTSSTSTSFVSSPTSSLSSSPSRARVVPNDGDDEDEDYGDLCVGSSITAAAAASSSPRGFYERIQLALKSATGNPGHGSVFSAFRPSLSSPISSATASDEKSVKFLAPISSAADDRWQQQEVTMKKHHN